MHFSEDEIRAVGLDQLTDNEVEKALAAFNGFSEIFGKDWVLARFQGMQSAAFVRSIINLWDDWICVKDLKGSETVLPRWKVGIYEAGVIAELHIMACLIRAGAFVELFPPVGNREADCRFRFSEKDPWIYCEISQRKLAEISKRAQNALTKISEAASKAEPDKHGKVAIMKIPTQEELDEICAWLESGELQGQSQLKDLAHFFGDPIDDLSNEKLDELLKGPHLFSTHLKLGGSPRIRGTASIEIRDEAASEVLETEAAQLPKDAPGIIFLDITGVLGGLDFWKPLIERRLQPTINTRISAVVLFQRMLDVSVGLTSKGIVIINPHAKFPIQNEIIAMINAFINI